MPRTRHSPGYYLALTFGTLLSSQGADAQKLNPLGLHLGRLVRLYAVLRIGVTPGGPTGWPPGRAAQPAHLALCYPTVRTVSGRALFRRP